jgi:hypothetical protein
MESVRRPLPRYSRSVYLAITPSSRFQLHRETQVVGRFICCRGCALARPSEQSECFALHAAADHSSSELRERPTLTFRRSTYLRIATAPSSVSTTHRWGNPSNLAGRPFPNDAPVALLRQNPDALPLKKTSHNPETYSLLASSIPARPLAG